MPPPLALPLLLAGIGLLIATLHRPSRRALLEAWRALARYPDLWRIPAGFAVGYAAFQFAATLLLHLRLAEPLPFVALRPPPAGLALLGESVWPAAERVAAVFNVFVATAPLAAWFALRLLGNTDDVRTELRIALRKRFGRGRGWLLLGALAIAAVAAVIKPALYLAMPELAPRVPWILPVAISLLAAAFELLLGVTVLTYLMLMTHAWLRGLHFDRGNLRRLAMRRTGFVLKWSLVLVAATILLVVAPVGLALLAPDDPGLFSAAEGFVAWVGRPAVVALALACLPVQAILVFHNESLRQALRDGRILLARQGTTLLPFFLAALAWFLALVMASHLAVTALGDDTFAAHGARVLASLPEGWLTGWLLAAWVCLYKGLPARRKEIPF